MADPVNGELVGLTGSSQLTALLTPQQNSPPLSEFRRITRGFKRRKNDTITFTGANETPSFEFSGGGEGRGTNLDEIAWLIANLKETITQQSQVIETLRKEQAELKAGQEQLKTQNAALQAEIREFKDELRRPIPSYADAARTPPVSLPTNVRTISLPNTTPATFTDTLHCTVDISRAGSEGDRVSAGTIRAEVEKEIRVMDVYANWRCRAVTVDQKNTNRIKIACRNEAEHQLVKRVAETKIGAGVRVLRDELYPIKVDNVKRTAVLDENDEIRAGAAETFSEENETTIAKISWLSKKDVPKAYGSMVVYLTKSNDARRLITEGFFHAGGESGTTSVFERRPRPDQCYNCQEIGHKAFQCKNGQKCARCARDGHHHGNCNEAVLRCVPCGGPHESFSRNCQKLYPSHHE
jgi:hypothetical protein